MDFWCLIPGQLSEDKSGFESVITDGQVDFGVFISCGQNRKDQGCEPAHNHSFTLGKKMGYVHRRHVGLM